MFEEWLNKLCKELNINLPTLDENKSCTLILSDEVTLFLQDLESNFCIKGNILPCPKDKRETLFIYLMKANYLKHGTGKASIGLDEKENFITLSAMLPCENSFRLFKEKIEDFVNYLTYWKEEVKNFNKGTIY